MKPGPIIETGTRAPARVFPTASSVFLTGEFERGKTGIPYAIRNLSQRDSLLGGRLAANPVAWDSIEGALALGAPQVIVSRICGPSAARAALTLNDAASTATMRVVAKGEGSYGNDFRVQVTAGSGTFTLIITHITDSTLNITSPEFTTVTQAVNWAASLGRGGPVDIEDLGASSLNPNVIAATALTGGTDNRGSISQTEVTAAWAAITEYEGPGYACSAGRTTDAAHAAVIAHAAATNRVARLTAPDTSTPATVTAKVDAARTTTGHTTAALVWPNWEIRGLVDTQVRVVPGDVVLAALEARNDAQGVNPAEAAAGELGVVNAPLFVGLTQPDATVVVLEAFAAKGTIPFRRLKDGSIRVYDSISVANPVTDQEYTDLGTGRLLMRLRAESEAVAERYQFKKITGERLLRVAAELDPIIRKYRDVLDGYQIEPRTLAECREAREFIVDVLVTVAETGRVVRFTITKEGTR